MRYERPCTCFVGKAAMALVCPLRAPFYPIVVPIFAHLATIVKLNGKKCPKYTYFRPITNGIVQNMPKRTFQAQIVDQAIKPIKSSSQVNSALSLNVSFNAVKHKIQWLPTSASVTWSSVTWCWSVLSIVEIRNCASLLPYQLHCLVYFMYHSLFCVFRSLV